MPVQRTYRRNIFSLSEVGWNLSVAFLTLWAVYHIPAGIVVGTSSFLALELLNWVLVVVFLIDPIASYRFTGIRGHQARRVFLRYLLPFDILAAIAILPIFQGTEFSLLALLKLAHVTVFINVWRHQLPRRGNVVRLALFLYWLAVLIHLVACGWLFIRHELPGANMNYEYLKAVYWTVTTLTTIGYGDITPQTANEMIYAIGVMLIGFLLMGYLIGNIASLLNKPDPLRAQYANALEEVSAFAQYHRLPGDLKHRIVDFFGYMWQQRAAFADAATLQHLPAGIRTEISLHLKRDVIQRVPFFREADDQFIREIANEMRPIVVTPGEFVFHIGDPANSMYFVSRGDLEVIDEKGAVIGTLSDGDFFGEMALLEKRRRMGTIRALDYCDIYELNAHAFARIVEAHPLFERYMQDVAQQRSSVTHSAT